MIIEQIKIISDLFNNAIQEIKKNNFQNKEKLKNINKNNSIKDNIIEVKTIKLNNNNNNGMREILSYNSYEDIKVFSNDELIKQRNSGKQNYLNYNDIKDEYKLVFGNLFTNFSGLFQNCSDSSYSMFNIVELSVPWEGTVSSARWNCQFHFALLFANLLIISAICHFSG